MKRLQTLQKWLNQNNLRLKWRTDLALENDLNIRGNFYCSIETKTGYHDLEYKVENCLVSRSGSGQTAMAAALSLADYIASLSVGSIAVFYDDHGFRHEIVVPNFD